MGGQMDGQMDGQMGGQMDGQMDGWAGRWTGRCRDLKNNTMADKLMYNVHPPILIHKITPSVD